VHRDLTALVRFDTDTVKADQRFLREHHASGLVSRGAEIGLWHFVRSALADIGDREGKVQSAVCGLARVSLE
jgi:hypothetical protein